MRQTLFNYFLPLYQQFQKAAQVNAENVFEYSNSWYSKKGTDRPSGHCKLYDDFVLFKSSNTAISPYFMHSIFVLLGN